MADCGYRVLGSQAEIHAAYIHVPFCFHKCHYCDFYSIVDNRDRQQQFVDRLVAEMQVVSREIKQPLKSIFVGGGTPTLLTPRLWTHLLDAISQHLPLSPGGEFTVEANPETVTDQLVQVLADGGVNRISIGCQSFNLRHLKTLERWHDPQSVIRTVEILRQHGMHNFNLDLIFAIPGQSMQDWMSDLDQAISLQPVHLSCYGLVYEPNTPLTVKMHSGRITPCDQELEAEMYEATRQRLAGAGFEQYEISNWARQVAHGQNADVQTNLSRHANRCQHNMIYWTNRNWWGLGPSASSHINSVRWKNVPRLGEYLETAPLPPIVDIERIDEDGCIGESFMLGLRLIEGLPLGCVEQLLDRGARATDRRQAIARHRDAGLLLETDSHLRLSDRGLLLADLVIADLL